MTIQQIAVQLNDGLTRSKSDFALCEKRLLEYQQENNLTLEQLNEMCWNNSVEMFEYIFR